MLFLFFLFSTVEIISTSVLIMRGDIMEYEIDAPKPRLTLEEKEQKQLISSYTRPQKDKLFLSLNSCPHCGKQIWVN